jgi:maleamate amidohydrolase
LSKEDQRGTMASNGTPPRYALLFRWDAPEACGAVRRMEKPITTADVAALTRKGFARPVGFGHRPALLIVDLIEGFTDPKSPLGSDVSETIDQANRLILAARARSFPIYFSTIRYDDAHCADAGVWGVKIGGLAVLSAESQGSWQDRRLLKERNDPIIVKKFASCFFGTDLLTRLIGGGIDTLVIAGCSTSGCVRATAVDACQHGLRAIVAREAVADRMVAAHHQSLVDIDLKYGDVLSVDQIVATLATIGTAAPVV